MGSCALAGMFYLYIQIDIFTREGTFALDGVVRQIVDGKADAPFQYRFLIPDVLVWIDDHTSYTIGQAVEVIDGIGLAVGAAIGFAILKRTGRGLYALPVGLYLSLLSIGYIALPKPETLTAFACATAALIALERRPVSDGWWSGRVAWAALVLSTVILLGCRTDVVFALAVGFGARYVARRQPVDAIAAGVLATSAIVATLALIARFPDAKYPSGVSMVQLADNFSAIRIVVVGLFVLPALAPLVIMWRHPAVAPRVRDAAMTHLPLLMVVAAQVVSSFVVGRFDEVRLFFPVAFALAWVGVEMWQAVFESLETEERPRILSSE